MLQDNTGLPVSMLARILVPAGQRSSAVRYGAAIALPVAGMAVTSSLANTSQAPFFPLFSIAVVLSSVIGGLWPALLTVAESALINVLLAPPSWSFHIASSDNAIRIGLFAVAGCAIAALIAAVGDLYNQTQIQHSQTLVTLRSIGDAVIATDAQGKISFMNPVAEQVTGWELAEARGVASEAVIRLINEITRATVEHPVTQVLETQTVLALANHTALVRRDGTQIPIEDSAAPIRDAQQRVVGAVLVFRDVTRARLNEAALRRADRLSVVGKLASTIAHEMNNPLEAVANLIYLAAQDEHLTPGTRRHLEAAQAELNRAAESSRRTLSLRRTSHEPTQVDLRNFVDSVLDLYKTIAANRHVQIENNVEPGRALTVFPAEMRQLISNIVSNALDAMPRGGKLRVDGRANDQNGTVRLSITDTGPGIPPENLERIFEPFFTTKDEVGTGLGLWVATRIAKEHGGDLTVESDGNGSTFIVELPAEPIAVTAGAKLRQRTVTASSPLGHA